MPDIDLIRSDFPILGEAVYGKPLVYLDNAATSQKPRQVLNRVMEFYLHQNSNVHRGVHYLSEMSSGFYESVRETVRSFINSEFPEEIIFTHGTTDSINLVADSFGRAFVNEGDEIIVTQMEHHSNFVPWQIMCETRGAVLKAIPVDPGGRLLIETLDALITERTRLLAVTYVSNALGTVNPVKAIAAAAHRRNVPVLIDAAQAVPHLPIDVQDLDCDFLVFSGHKMYAETGIGVLYGKKRYLDRMPPYQTGGGMIARVKPDKTTFLQLPLKFEAGTVNIAAAISLAAAIEYLQDIGFEAICAHETDIIKEAVETLSAIDGVCVHGHPPRCGILSFNLENAHCYDVGILLDKMGVAVRTGHHCAQPLMDQMGLAGTVRASFALYNTSQDIERLAAAIRKAQSMLSCEKSKANISHVH
jgi:cysteine desulfurase/selenocysteine lyase